MSKPCTVSSCDRPSIARGWCSMHYGRWQRYGDPRPDMPPYGATPGCAVEGCQRPHDRHGYCGMHAIRVEKRGEPGPVGPVRRLPGTPPPPCSEDGCDLPAATRGFCANHYAHWRRRHRVKGTCSVIGCGDPVQSRGVCMRHYHKVLKYGDPTAGKTYDRTREPGSPGRTMVEERSGYRYVHWPEHPNASGNGRVAEHTVVMAEHLGRPLRKGESVHHKNGERADNRLCNLELWASTHRSGQRVTDLLAWAHELIEQYRDTPQLWPEHLQP